MLHHQSGQHIGMAHIEVSPFWWVYLGCNKTSWWTIDTLYDWNQMLLIIVNINITFLGDGGGIITIRPLFEAAGIFSGFK